MPKRYNTPHRSRVVKTRLTEDEYADFTARLAPYGISQSEFLRQAIRRTTIRPVLHVSSVNDELLSAVGKLAAEYGRIGGNLNQIARYLNEYGAPYHALSGEVRAAIADLAALKYEAVSYTHLYVVAEQTPADVGKELANRHFNKDYPKEVTLPCVPDISQDGNTGETDINYQTGSPYYRYDSTDTPEELIRKYKICLLYTSWEAGNRG